jgi:hypothetical protein
MQMVEAPEVQSYIERTLGVTITPPARAFGFVDHAGQPLCAVVWNDYNGANIELTMVAERMTRGVLRYLAHYAFVKNGCRRLTVRTKKRNKQAIRAAQRIGFHYEAVIKRYFLDDDAVMFRMYSEECRWLR